MVRHRGADNAAREEPVDADFSSLGDAKQGLVVTFKASGEGVPTPVNIAQSGGKLYFRSEPHVAKMRRLANNDVVHVCACTLRGKPTGPVIAGRARVLPDSEKHVGDHALAANWTLSTKLME